MVSANGQSSLRFMEYLDESDSRLKLALQVTNSSMWEWNIRTGKVAWSENFEQLCGVSPGTLKETYRGLLERILQADRRSVTQAIARALREEAEYNIEFRIGYPDGSIRWLATQGRVARDKNSRPVKMTGICRDITLDKQVEAAQLQDETQNLDSQGISPHKSASVSVELISAIARDFA